MDRCRWIGFTLAGILVFALGCSKSQPGSSDVAVSQKPADQATGESGTPEGAVHEFLEAVRTGNDDKASGMLTPIARKKTAEVGLVVAPPKSDTASFKVGEVEYVTPEKDGAHVATTWTDMVSGQEHTDQILWILRRESDGWRIAGMATKVFEDELPLILNFEDPDDMLRKQKLAGEELERRTAAAASQATRPVQPDDSIKQK